MLYQEKARNKYLLSIPNFSQYLIETLIPLLTSAYSLIKEKCIKLIKDESLFYEWNLKIEDILLELAQLCYLQAEYRARINYKYVDTQQL